jgi:hypothetical protein
MIRQLAPEPTPADDFMQHPLVHDNPASNVPSYQFDSLPSVRVSPIRPSSYIFYIYIYPLSVRFSPVRSSISLHFHIRLKPVYQLHSYISPISIIPSNYKCSQTFLLLNLFMLLCIYRRVLGVVNFQAAA